MLLQDLKPEVEKIINQPETNKDSKYRADNYISNIDTNYWYDFKSKDVFESNNNYYLVLLK